MKIYYDTEFTSLDENVESDLISAGFVAETGAEWYAEISDFNRYACSAFVMETVLPLLDARLDQCMPGSLFSLKLCEWLRSFDVDIELISDHPCDWLIVNRYGQSDLAAMPVQVHGKIWQRTEDEGIRKALTEAEHHFWQQHAGKQHHALYDARRLKLIVELQLQQEQRKI